MRLIVLSVAIAVAVWLSTFAVDPQGVLRWAVAQQRAFQNEMANAIRGLRAGDGGAWATLLAAAGAYGFVHALGPGHGKIVIGGVGLGADVGAGRLVGLAAISSIAQALWAIALVYGGFLVFETSARRLTDLAEGMLAPASYAAIAVIGAVLVWRGGRALGHRITRPHHRHAACGCGGHGPAPDEVARLSSWREGVALVLGIAVRPCTGAIFLLVIAWQMELRAAGMAAVLVMGLGTAALTSVVALSSSAARRLAWMADARTGRLTFAAPALQIASGLLIVWASLGLLV